MDDSKAVYGTVLAALEADHARVAEKERQTAAEIAITVASGTAVSLCGAGLLEGINRFTGWNLLGGDLLHPLVLLPGAVCTMLVMSAFMGRRLGAANAVSAD